MKFPLAIDNFKKLRQSGAIYVDKTLLIHEMLSDATEAFLIARPRRFGKTLNMSMIKYFFDIKDAAENRKLFEDTKIATATYESGKGENRKMTQCMDQQGKYPVVFITLKELRALDYETMLNHLRVLMAKLYEEHRYILEKDDLSTEEKAQFISIAGKKSDESTLAFSLKTLTEYVSNYYGQPVILLVDEYDTPMHTAYSHADPFHEALSAFMAIFLGGAFKGNDALKQGVLTGILRVSLMNLFSGFNSVIVRSVLSTQYSEHFGFTEDEVSGLFTELGRERDEEKVKAWYNGYVVGNTTIYNPWSIMCCLENHDEFEAYWVETGYHGVLGKALISSTEFDVFDKLRDLIEGKTIEVMLDQRTIFANLHDNQMALWTLMLFSGYLKAVKQWKVDAKKYAELAIPNLEVHDAIESMVDSWIRIRQSQTMSINTELLQSLISGDVEGFRSVVEDYILQTISFYEFSFKTTERFYHIFMLGMLLGLKDQFIIDSNKEAGLGRYDIILIPKDKTLSGVVIELKRVDVKTAKQERALEADRAMREDLLEAEAEKALDQIEEKNYAVKFAQHDIKKFVALGMAFLGKEVSVRSRVITGSGGQAAE